MRNWLKPVDNTHDYDLILKGCLCFFKDESQQVVQLQETKAKHEESLENFPGVLVESIYIQKVRQNKHKNTWHYEQDKVCKEHAREVSHRRNA